MSPALLHKLGTRMKGGVRRGYTTGTRAQAATKGSCLMLKKAKLIDSVRVRTPLGQYLKIGLTDQEIGKGFAKCAVIKDSGDDPDVTNGAKIYAQVRISPKKVVSLKGGEGVGRVTKPGLAVGVGEWAINPVPRKMILREAKTFLPEARGLEVTISVAKGKKIAQHTFNPRLGIVGGISIIGTTGIVEPKSTEAYKASLTLQLEVLKAQGYKKAILVLGYVGEKFCKEVLKIKEDQMIKIGDHVGFMLKECARKKLKDILLIGHIGKLIKLASGQFNTHSMFGDNRITAIARYAKDYARDKTVIEEILKESTAEATIEIIKEAGLGEVFTKIAQEVRKKASEFVENRIKINCIILSLKGEVLGLSRPSFGVGSEGGRAG